MLLLVILSQWFCFSPSIMALFHCHRYWLLFFGCCFVSSLPISLTFHSDIWLHLNYFHERSYFRHIPPPSWKPASVLVLYSGNNTVDGDWSCSNTAPLSPLLATGGPPVKNRPGSLYDSAYLIMPEGRIICKTWHPPCCGHRRSGCCPCHNCLVTEAYTQSVIPYGQKYWEWKAISKV